MGWTKQTTSGGTTTPSTSILSGLKYTAIGDSITSTAYASIPYPNLIGTQTGAIITNKGVSGWRMMRIAGANNCILDLVNALTGTEDIVTLAGGYNDQNSFVLGTMTDRVDSTFYGAYHLACSTMLAKCPGKRIATFTLFPDGTKNSGNATETSLNQINQAIKDVSAYYSIPNLDLWNNGGLPVFLDYFKTNYTLNDGIHFNNAGHAIIARRIKAFLESL
jgi:lysophospholipase L1-like esterase